MPHKYKNTKQPGSADTPAPMETRSWATVLSERFQSGKVSVYKAITMMFLGAGLIWALLRVGTFFLLPTLDKGYQQTVNVSPWWVVLGIQGLCLGIIVVVCVVHFFVDISGSVIWVVSGLIVAASIVFESFIQLVIPGMSMADWAFYANTKASLRSYERQVKVTPYTLQYRSLRVKNAQIENWECRTTPIKTDMSFLPKYADQPLCLTVHEGYFGWEWIDNLRVCSETDMRMAQPISPCEVWAPGMPKIGFPKNAAR
ncbi:MAG: hypothetical protein WAV95_13595 [Azonexus sp.]